MENVFDVSKYIIQHESENGRPVTNLRLQKLLYFVQAYCLSSLGKKCFNERIEAWQYGPVVPEVYRDFKFYGSLAIIASDTTDKNTLIKDSAIRSAIDTALDDGKDFTTSQLIDISHRQSPWINAYDGGMGHGVEITEHALRKEFCR